MNCLLEVTFDIAINATCESTLAPILDFIDNNLRLFVTSDHHRGSVVREETLCH